MRYKDKKQHNKVDPIVKVVEDGYGAYNMEVIVGGRTELYTSISKGAVDRITKKLTKRAAK